VEDSTAAFRKGPGDDIARRFRVKKCDKALALLTEHIDVVVVLQMLTEEEELRLLPTAVTFQEAADDLGHLLMVVLRLLAVFVCQG